MTSQLVLAVIDGVVWYRFAQLLFWAGIFLTIAFSIRAAVLTRGDNTVRLWQRSFGADEKRAVARRRSYQ
jgi:hypothetical protein